MTTMTAPTTRTTRHRLAAAALIAGPLLLVAGNVLSQDGDTEDPTYVARLAGHAGAEQGSILLFILGFALLLGGGVAMAHAVTGRGARLAGIGLPLALIGTIGFACLSSSGLFNITAAQSLPAAQASSIMDKVGNLPAAAVLVAVGLLALPIGFILLTLSQWRAGLAPVWVPIAVFLGFAVVTVLEGQLGGITGDLFMLAGFGYAGLRLARTEG
jgi:hypothetical protein